MNSSKVVTKMNCHKLNSLQLVNWLNKLAASYRLVAPVRDEEGVVLFKPVTEAEQVTIDYTNPDFTQMAGGHNPRASQKERVRNRFLHKLKYHMDRYGVVGCVGCGRCIEKCPVNIDLARIIDDLKELV